MKTLEQFDDETKDFIKEHYVSKEEYLATVVVLKSKIEQLKCK
jgi:hypothetical protein